MRLPGQGGIHLVCAFRWQHHRLLRAGPARPIPGCWQRPCGVDKYSLTLSHEKIAPVGVDLLVFNRIDALPEKKQLRTLRSQHE